MRVPARAPRQISTHPSTVLYRLHILITARSATSKTNIVSTSKLARLPTQTSIAPCSCTSSTLVCTPSSIDCVDNARPINKPPHSTRRPLSISARSSELVSLLSRPRSTVSLPRCSRPAWRYRTHATPASRSDPRRAPRCYASCMATCQCHHTTSPTRRHHHHHHILLLLLMLLPLPAPARHGALTSRSQSNTISSTFNKCDLNCNATLNARDRDR